ncbi:MAG TPA: hypothetical protein PKW15_03885 [Alphaproteobacteria bacterium]|nr:hypothetical protein [Rhodospirillaceae bacterium]HRJ12367.1 hypothetical protein [Alphaproteobacteria bacterium]
MSDRVEISFTAAKATLRSAMIANMGGRTPEEINLHARAKETLNKFAAFEDVMDGHARMSGNPITEHTLSVRVAYNEASVPQKVEWLAKAIDDLVARTCVDQKPISSYPRFAKLQPAGN